MQPNTSFLTNNTHASQIMQEKQCELLNQLRGIDVIQENCYPLKPEMIWKHISSTGKALIDRITYRFTKGADINDLAPDSGKICSIYAVPNNTPVIVHFDGRHQTNTQQTFQDLGHSKNSSASEPKLHAWDEPKNFESLKRRRRDASPLIDQKTQKKIKKVQIREQTRRNREMSIEQKIQSIPTQSYHAGLYEKVEGFGTVYMPYVKQRVSLYRPEDVADMRRRDNKRNHEGNVAPIQNNNNNYNNHHGNTTSVHDNNRTVAQKTTKAVFKDIAIPEPEKSNNVSQVPLTLLKKRSSLKGKLPASGASSREAKQRNNLSASIQCTPSSLAAQLSLQQKINKNLTPLQSIITPTTRQLVDPSTNNQQPSRSIFLKKRPEVQPIPTEPATDLDSRIENRKEYQRTQVNAATIQSDVVFNQSHNQQREEEQQAHQIVLNKEDSQEIAQVKSSSSSTQHGGAKHFDSLDNISQSDSHNTDFSNPLKCADEHDLSSSGHSSPNGKEEFITLPAPEKSEILNDEKIVDQKIPEAPASPKQSSKSKDSPDSGFNTPKKQQKQSTVENPFLAKGSEKKTISLLQVIKTAAPQSTFSRFESPSQLVYSNVSPLFKNPLLPAQANTCGTTLSSTSGTTLMEEQKPIQVSPTLQISASNPYLFNQSMPTPTAPAYNYMNTQNGFRMNNTLSYSSSPAFSTPAFFSNPIDARNMFSRKVAEPSMNESSSSLFSKPLSGISTTSPNKNILNNFMRKKDKQRIN